MSDGAVPSTFLVKPRSADCNLACTYCFYTPKTSLYPEASPRMSEETLERFIEEALMTCEPRVSFVWQGGEPTLAGLKFFRKAVELQNMYRYPNQVIENSIQTNGVLVDDEWALFFNRHNWLVGVSLDGPSDIHDAYRITGNGSGSYEQVKKAIATLRTHGVQFNILALLNNLNVKKPSELYRHLVNEGYRHLQFIPCMETAPDGTVTEFSITPEEYGEFLNGVFDEWVKDIPEVYVRDFEDLFIGIVTGETPNCVYNGKCGEYLVVEYNGDSYPCDFFVEPEWLLGNINETGIEELYNSDKMVQFREGRKLHEKCANCNRISYCHGGCQKTVHKDGYYFCDSMKRFLDQNEEKILQIVRKRPLQS